MNAIAEQVREAYAKRRRLRIAAAGGWLDAGYPVEVDEVLTVAGHHGIVEYVPGDLTLTALAGTPLSYIAHVASVNRQWLPLDPWGGDAGTLGATISTASAGPHAAALGLPRDLVLGTQFITGRGQVVRSGGRVVKNVAGFDLTRLIVGSWGTLGVITEVTVRLRSLPEHVRTIGTRLPAASRSLSEMATRLRALPFTPLAAEVLGESVSRKLGLDDATVLLVRLAGNETSVKSQAELLMEFGDQRDVDDSVWMRLRAIESGRTGGAWRWSQLPSLFEDTWAAAHRACQGLDDVLIHGCPARGVVRVLANGEGDGASLARAAHAFSGTIAIERLPRTAWSSVKVTLPNDALSRAVREKFDPARILNPGILGGIT